jgi:hypothetical protein
MRLDRNVEGLGNKYALIKMRRLRELQGTLTEEGQQRLSQAFDLLEAAGILDWANTPETECFVIRLKDIGAKAALRSYADVFHGKGGGAEEYADDIEDLARRSGPGHPNCKVPD